MKIAILGNGKMGILISKLAIQRGHTIVTVSSSKNPGKDLDLSDTDVAIDFSTPNSAFDNISHAIKNGIPTISGTTGWLDKINEIYKLCNKKENGAFLHSSNFSLGMNMFFKLNKNLAQLMQKKEYNSSIHETHHKNKLDSPSGTAISLQNDINSILGEKSKITSERINQITGTHKVIYSCNEDEIEIKHTAKNRNGFAMGAVLAAEWIKGKNGVFTLNDII